MALFRDLRLNVLSKGLGFKNQKALTTLFGDFKANENGNFAILTGVALTVLISGLAVATDISNAFSAKSRLQDTADAIALMAVRDNLKSQKALEKAANSYLDSHYHGNNSERVKIQSITRQGDRVNVQAYNNIDTYFSAIFGRDTLDITAQSQAIYDNRGLDIALVLDTTGSMKGTKLSNLKSSATSLIDLLDKQDNPNLRLSVVPFSQYVNIGPKHADKTWLDNPYGHNWKGCVGSRSNGKNLIAAYGGVKFPAVKASYCPNALQPLSNNTDMARKTISKMKASGWTYMPAGLAWGYRTLDSSAPFTQTKTTKTGVNKTEKVLVLMTDGANTRSASGQNHTGKDIVKANNNTEALCAAAKAENIKIYTIAFQLESDSASKKARAILEGCASAKENFFDAKSASDLNAAFKNIGEMLIQPRLTA